MRITRWGTAVAAVFACIATGSPATHYVDLNSPNPTAPFTNWVTAATNIQDAVDAASVGDEVLVTNGLYATGGRTVGTNVPANRVTVDKPISVRSVNGNEFTLIQGEILRYGGAASIRCVYLAAGASLTGFTLTNGSVPPSEMYGGGVFCESTSAVLNSCLIVSNFSFAGGGGAFSGTLNNCTISHNLCYVGPGGGTLFSTVRNCVLSANLAYNPVGGLNGGGACGGSLTHCMLISNAATFRGGGAISNMLNDCVLIGNSSGYSGGGISDSTASNSTFTGNSSSNGGGVDDSTAINCTLTQNTATEDGGGAYISTLMNCAVLGNSAVGQSGTFGFGGGVYMTRLYNCRVIGNSGLQGGGAASGGLLANCELSGNTAINGGGASGVGMENCTVAGNTATNSGGGTSGCNLANCIVYFNSASSNANYDGGTLSYCCTVPLPAGSGNFTNDPSFIDFYGGNLRLQTNSPCINAGDNTQVLGTTDLDGRPRIVGGTVDLGAYEFQGLGIGEFTAWLQSYGLPTDGSADYADSDGDGMNNWQEWICGTDPTNPQSVLKMLPPLEAGGNLLVRWESVAGKIYALERSTNLDAVPPFSVLQSNIVGQAGTTAYIDTNSPGNGPSFYRLSVQR